MRKFDYTKSVLGVCGHVCGAWPLLRLWEPYPRDYVWCDRCDTKVTLKFATDDDVEDDLTMAAYRKPPKKARKKPANKWLSL